VVDHLFERRRAVVVEVRCGVPDAAQSRHVELVPIIRRRRAADEPGQ
jgi:hypothetical protein